MDDLPRLPNVNVEKNTLESFHAAIPYLPVEKNAKEGILSSVQSSKKMISCLSVLKYKDMPTPS